MNAKSFLSKFTCKKNTIVQLYQIDGDLVWRTSKISLKKAIGIQKLQEMEVEKFALSTFEQDIEPDGNLLEIWIANRQNLSPARKTSDQDGVLVLQDLLNSVAIEKRTINLSQKNFGIEWYVDVNSDSLLNTSSSVSNAEVKEWDFNRESKNIVFAPTFQNETGIEEEKKEAALKKKEVATTESTEKNLSIPIQFMTAHWISTLKRASCSLLKHAGTTALILSADVLMLSTFANLINLLMILPVVGADIWYISKIAQKDQF